MVIPVANAETNRDLIQLEIQFTEDDLGNAICAVKNRAATGFDGIPYNILKFI